MKNCNMQPAGIPECALRERGMEARMDVHMDSRMGNCMDEHMRKVMPGERCFMRENDTYQCEKFPIGMGYVPWQEFKDIYDMERGLNAGTIFAELEKPFWGRRAYRR